MAAKEHFESKNNTVIEYALGFKHGQQKKYSDDSLKASTLNSFTNLNSSSIASNLNSDVLNKSKSSDGTPHYNWFETKRNSIAPQNTLELSNVEPEDQTYIASPAGTKQFIIREMSTNTNAPTEEKNSYLNETEQSFNRSSIFNDSNYSNSNTKEIISQSKSQNLNEKVKISGETYDGEAYDLCNRGIEKWINSFFGSKKCCIYVSIVVAILIIVGVVFLLLCLLYFGALNTMPSYLQSCTASNPCVTNKNLYCNGTCVCSGIQSWNGTFCG